MITIPGEPVAWQRAGYRKSTGGIYNRNKMRQAENTIAWTVRTMCRKMRCSDKGRFTLSAVFYLGKHRKGRRPDLSNLVKLIEDALKGIVWRDDEQIDHYGNVDKFHHQDEPRTEIRWEESNEFGPVSVL